MLDVVIGDEAATKFTCCSFSERHHAVIAYGVIYYLFAVSVFAQHSADVWGDMEQFSNTGSSLYAEIVASGTAFCVEEGCHALSFGNGCFKVRAIWKNYLYETLGDFTASGIWFPAVRAKEWHQLLRGDEPYQVPLFVSADL